MARVVKCVYCSEKGMNDDFFKVQVKGKNKYYCSEDEYKLYQKLEEEKIAEKEALYLERQIKEAFLKQESVEYKKLSNYIFEELIEYVSGQKFPTYIGSRIKELRKFYKYQIIYESFHRNHEVITWAIKNKDFATEFHMGSYIMKIVEGSINDVYKEWKLKDTQNKRIERNAENVSFMQDVDTQLAPVKKKENIGIMNFLEEDEM